MAYIPCTPNDLLAAYPCSSCLSDRSLLALIALALCRITGQSLTADCTVATLAEDAKCFTCMSDHQMLEAIFAILWRFAIDEGYLEAGTNLREEAACLDCADPKTIRAIILKKICDGASAGTLLCVSRV